jgi:hypothetical protein
MIIGLDGVINVGNRGVWLPPHYLDECHADDLVQHGATKHIPPVFVSIGVHSWFGKGRTFEPRMDTNGRE